jgi:hypothetical protein
VLDGSAATVGGDREAWVELGAARAAGWSMESLADRYEEHYRALVVGRPS